MSKEWIVDQPLSRLTFCIKRIEILNPVAWSNSRKNTFYISYVLFASWWARITPCFLLLQPGRGENQVAIRSGAEMLLYIILVLSLSSLLLKRKRDWFFRDGAAKSVKLTNHLQLPQRLNFLYLSSRHLHFPFVLWLSTEGMAPSPLQLLFY